MSFTTGMLAKAQETYANALSGKMTRFAGRRLEQHGIAALRAEITHWQTAGRRRNGARSAASSPDGALRNPGQSDSDYPGFYCVSSGLLYT